MATKPINPDVSQEPSSGLTKAEQAAQAASAPKPPAKKKEDSPKPINPEFTQEPSKNFAKGGSVGSASRRADGCATKGKTKGRIY
jgi:hypothetical protein